MRNDARANLGESAATHRRSAITVLSGRVEQFEQAAELLGLVGEPALADEARNLASHVGSRLAAVLVNEPADVG